MTTLVLVFRKIESGDKTKYGIFIQSQKLKWLSMKVTLMMCFNQSRLQLYEAFRKGAAWITNWVLTIDSVIDSVINSFYVLVKDFNTFVHDHNLDCQR